MHKCGWSALPVAVHLSLRMLMTPLVIYYSTVCVHSRHQRRHAHELRKLGLAVADDWAMSAVCMQDV